MALLEICSVSKHFGGLKAVDCCSLSVEPGAIVGLIGPNGAGKTTLFNVVAGFLPATGGEVRFRGQSLRGLTASQIAARGVVRTFQTPHGFTGMSVIENLMAAPLQQRGERLVDLIIHRAAVRKQEKEIKLKAMALLDTIGLADRKDELVGNLNPSEARLLELIRQLLLDPKILLLDEPAAGINPALQGNLVANIKSMRDRGLTLLIVDHNLAFVLSLCDYIYAMDRGRIIAEGVPDRIMSDSKVREVYLGREQ